MSDTPQLPPPAASAHVKAHNLVVVWRCIVDHAPISRAAIAQRTGLSKGALTALAGELIDRGLVHSIGAADITGRGRRAELLEPGDGGRVVAAVHVRGDDLYTLVMDLAGRQCWREITVHDRPMSDPAAMATQIALAIERAERASAPRQLERVCIVMSAPLFGDPPIIPAAVDFGWWNVDLLALVRQALRRDVPLRLDNDAACAATAERHALAQAPSTMIYLKSDTGIGGAAFVHGRLLQGAHRMAFEPGHIVVDPDGPACACGQRGCLVTVAGPDVVLAAAGLADLASTRGVGPALAELIERSHAKDGAAAHAIESAVAWIVRALTIMEVLFDPELIVLGGYWAHLVDRIRLDHARARRSIAGERAPIVSSTPLVPAALGEDAAVLGAVSDDIRRVVAEMLGAEHPGRWEAEAEPSGRFSSSV